jgi:hypothetical protein
MLRVTAIREEQRDDCRQREKGQRAVDQAARTYFEAKHVCVTRNSQHNRASVSLKGKSRFERINFSAPRR